jgi:hypothetical protein
MFVLQTTTYTIKDVARVLDVVPQSVTHELRTHGTIGGVRLKCKTRRGSRILIPAYVFRQIELRACR